MYRNTSTILTDDELSPAAAAQRYRTEADVIMTATVLGFLLGAEDPELFDHPPQAIGDADRDAAEPGLAPRGFEIPDAIELQLFEPFPVPGRYGPVEHLHAPVLLEHDLVVLPVEVDDITGDRGEDGHESRGQRHATRNDPLGKDDHDTVHRTGQRTSQRNQQIQPQI